MVFRESLEMPGKLPNLSSLQIGWYESRDEQQGRIHNYQFRDMFMSYSAYAMVRCFVFRVIAGYDTVTEKKTKVGI